MKALTVRQPYGSRIVSGAKTVENRGRMTHLRGQVLIHAGAQLHDRFKADEWPNIARLPRAAVLGHVQLVGAHEASWIPGTCCAIDSGAEWPVYDEGDVEVYHWLLADPIEFVTPIPHVKGALGFWEPDDRVAHLSSIAEVKA